MAAATLGFGVAIASGFSSLPVIYTYTAIMGTLLMVEIPSKRAYMSGIVGPAALGSALALEMLSLNIAWFVGSNLGGVIAKLVDPSIAYIVIGGVFALNYWLLRALPIMFRPDDNPAADGALKATLRSLADGFRFARANNAIFAGLLVVGVSNFFGFAFESMAPAFARDVYKAGPTGFGLLMSAQGLGALVAAGYMTFRGRRMKNPGLLLIGSAMIQAVGSIGFSFARTIEVGFLAIAGLGMISLVFAITHTLLILLASPPNIRGRIMGFQILMMGLFPLGSLALGLAADVIGLGQAVRLSAAIGLALLILIWVKYPDLRKPLG
jgi:predicted MFS family arabinose efflux permease